MSKFRRELREAKAPLPAAHLRRLGISKHVIAGRSWTQTSRGFHRPSTTAPCTTTQRILDIAAALPAEGVLAGWAAAFVHGIDTLDGLDDHSMQPLPVPVLLTPNLHREQIAGVRYRQRERPTRYEEVAGVRITPLADTAVDLARWGPNLTEAVVAVDSILRSNSITRDQLLLVASRVRGPGARQVQQAITMSRPGVRSPWESRLRMFWALQLALPMPLVNPPVFDLGGCFLGAPDLLDEEAGLAMEYDGARWESTTKAGHRDVDQHRADNHREEGFERTALIVVRADKGDLTRQRAKLATRLRSARTDGLGRDRSRDRWTLTAPPGWLGLPA